MSGPAPYDNNDRGLARQVSLWSHCEIEALNHLAELRGHADAVACGEDPLSSLGLVAHLAGQAERWHRAAESFAAASEAVEETAAVRARALVAQAIEVAEGALDSLDDQALSQAVSLLLDAAELTLLPVVLGQQR